MVKKIMTEIERIQHLAVAMSGIHRVAEGHINAYGGKLFQAEQLLKEVIQEIQETAEKNGLTN